MKPRPVAAAAEIEMRRVLMFPGNARIGDCDKEYVVNPQAAPFCNLGDRLSRYTLIS